MSDEGNQFLDMIQRTLRTIRDETERKVRQAQFAERKTPEQIRREEEALDKFKAAIDPLCGDDEPPVPEPSPSVGPEKRARIRELLKVNHPAAVAMVHGVDAVRAVLDEDEGAA